MEGVGTIGIRQVGVANQLDVSTADSEREVFRPNEVAYDIQRGFSVSFTMAVQVSGKAVDGVRDIRLCADSQVYERSHK